MVGSVGVPARNAIVVLGCRVSDGGKASGALLLTRARFSVEAMRFLRDVPIVVFTGKELTEEEESRLRTVAKSVVLKDVQSPERLFDETALFLHRLIEELPAPKRKLLERLHGFGCEFNAILELWPPPERDIEATVAKEAQWAMESVAYLRQYIKD